VSEDKPSLASDGVRFVGAIVLAVVGGLCVASWPRNGTDSRTADRAKAAQLRPKLCTPEAEKAALGVSVIRRFDPVLGLIVDRPAWDQLEYEHRAWLAAWACVCKFDGADLSIKDSRTRERLALYTPTLGYNAHD